MEGYHIDRAEQAEKNRRAAARDVLALRRFAQPGGGPVVLRPPFASG